MSAVRKMDVPLYTYADYAAWDDDVRCELIDGVVYNMAAPHHEHQDVLGEIFHQFKTHLKGKTCKPYIFPIDVRLFADNPFKRDDTVVQPDMIVVCDPSKLGKKGTILGAPDFVLEVLSPSSGKMDTLLKFKKYQEAGVREYWMVDMQSESIEICFFEENLHHRHVYAITDPVAVNILPDCTIDISELFPPEPSEGELTGA